MHSSVPAGAKREEPARELFGKNILLGARLRFQSGQEKRRRPRRLHRWAVRHRAALSCLSRLPNLQRCHSVAKQQQDANANMPNNLWQRGVSGNPAGRPRGSRNKLTEAVVCALLRDFSEHGEKAIAKVRRDQPGVWLKIIAMVIAREQRVENSNPLKDLTDGQLEAMIEYIEAALGAKAGDQAKVIEGIAEPTALPAPELEPQRKRPNRLLEHADSAVGPKERMPRKVRSPPGP